MWVPSSSCDCPGVQARRAVPTAGLHKECTWCINMRISQRGSRRYPPAQFDLLRPGRDCQRTVHSTTVVSAWQAHLLIAGTTVPVRIPPSQLRTWSPPQQRLGRKFARIQFVSRPLQRCRLPRPFPMSFSLFTPSRRIYFLVPNKQSTASCKQRQEEKSDTIRIITLRVCLPLSLNAAP